MTEIEKAIPLAMIIPFVPPAVQKKILDWILRDANVLLSDKDLKEYEDYFKRVKEKFSEDYMRKK